ncbi:ABC transporter domain-containing protein [Hortaea werneckii]|nr:ABC transporter domain-containing protein [Hortaea werneckii]
MVRKQATATEGSGITVTAQQSRFHTDAEDAPSAAREIVIKDLSVSIGDRELLSHADLNLQSGRHYVLVGRNGTGKSTLLKALGTEGIPGVPRSVRILLLGQTDEPSEGQNANPDDSRAVTVVEHVLRSDKHRERLIEQAKRLSAAVEDTEDPIAAVRVYRELSCERLDSDVAEARQIANRRSGARGLKARKELIRLEEGMSEAVNRLQELSLTGGNDEQVESSAVAEENQKAHDLLETTNAALADMDASKAEALARSVLLGLGFSTASIDNPVSELSGGWRTRCNLACALCQSSDLLLLDEPTNFLDLPSIMWLQGYIQNMSRKTTVILVTHDRAFADAVGEELTVLRNQVLERFKGALSEYEVERLRKYKYLSRMKDAQEKQKKHMQSSIDNNVKAAKRSGDDKKLKQATSRKKKLGDRMGMEVSAKGTRFKLNRDLVGWHESHRDAIEVPEFDPPPRMEVPPSPPDLRTAGPLLSFEGVSFAYKSSDKAVLQDVSLTIHPGDRVGLVGLNGSGTVTRHSRARYGRFSQQAVEELDVIAAENEALTALSHLMSFAGSDLAEKEARGLLSGLGLPGRIASDVPIKLLSGGQKVRLALAKLLYVPPHLLILDEVTTHLDSDTIQALALALRHYEGAILVVTHDRFFMRCVVEGEHPKDLAASNVPDAGEELPEESEESDSESRPGVVYRISRGKLSKLENGMQQYEDIAARSSAKLGKV